MTIQDDKDPHISTESHKELSVSPSLHPSVKFQFIELLTQLKMDVYQRRQNGYGPFLVQKTLKGTKVVFELKSEIYIIVLGLTENVLG